MAANERLDAMADQERADHIRWLVSFASSRYVLPLYLSFCIADYLWYRGYFWKFFCLRVVALTLTSIVNYANAKMIPSLKNAQLSATGLFGACCWPIHAMIWQIHDPGTPYYAGLMLVVAGMGSFRLTPGFYVFNSAQIILPVFVAGFIHGGFNTSTYFLLNIFFLFSVSVILLISRWFIERLHERELDVRQQLFNEIQSRDTVIKTKTEEALRMNSLAKQFSPQIISSMRNGKLSLDGKVHRAEICAVFVDIVGSTDKFIRLDRDDLQKILKMYMDDVMGTFLKYDITIDKFLGDGVLAFSNDPVEQSDYIDRVLRAAVEILEKVESKQEEYNAYWLSEFQISFGISSGYASVGFYGSDLHVKSYTAIGRVVNLAARLGSAAEANEILVSQELVTKLKKTNSPLLEELNFEGKGFGKLKGFESEQIRIFSIHRKGEKRAPTLLNQDADTCPHGHGLLYLAQDESGIYFFKCRFCDYALHENVAEPAKRGIAS